MATHAPTSANSQTPSTIIEPDLIRDEERVGSVPDPSCQASPRLDIEVRPAGRSTWTRLGLGETSAPGKPSRVERTPEQSPVLRGLGAFLRYFLPCMSLQKPPSPRHRGGVFRLSQAHSQFWASWQPSWLRGCSIEAGPQGKMQDVGIRTAAKRTPSLFRLLRHGRGMCTSVGGVRNSISRRIFD